MTQFSSLEMMMLGVPRHDPLNPFQQQLLNELSEIVGMLVIQDRQYTAQIYAKTKVRKFRGMYQRECEGNIFGRELIIMNADPNTLTWWRVLVHELSHATGAKSRANRLSLNAYGRSWTIGWEEALADVASLRLLDFFGLELSDDERMAVDARAAEHLLLSKAYGCPYSPQHFEAEVSQAMSIVIFWLEQTSMFKAKAVAA